MIHRNLSTKKEQHFATNINSVKTRVLLQLGDGMEQVRVQLTVREVDELIADLQQRKADLLKWSV